MLKKIMGVIKLNPEVAGEVFGAQHPVTTMERLRGLLAALCGVNRREVSVVNDGSTCDTKLTKVLDRVSADIPKSERKVAGCSANNLLTEDQVYRLRKVIALMNANRMKFLENKQELNKSQLKKNSKCRFSPKLSPKSQYIAKNSEKRSKITKDKVPIHDYLLAKGKESTSIRLKLEQNKSMKELEGCTFKPYTSPKTNEIVKTKDMGIFKRLTQTTAKPKF